MRPSSRRETRARSRETWVWFAALDSRRAQSVRPGFGFCSGLMGGASPVVLALHPLRHFPRKEGIERKGDHHHCCN